MVSVSSYWSYLWSGLELLEKEINTLKQILYLIVKTLFVIKWLWFLCFSDISFSDINSGLHHLFTTCPGVHFFAGHRLHSTALEEHLNELEGECAHERPAERREYPHMSKAGAASKTQGAKRSRSSRSAAGLVQIWPFSTFLPVMNKLAVASLKPDWSI